MLQVLETAIQATVVNIRNHFSTNFRPRTQLWISLKLKQEPDLDEYFTHLTARKLRSWSRLLYNVVTDDALGVWTELPVFKSLAMPPPVVASFLDTFVAQVRYHIGLLPVTTASLQQHPHRYLK